MLLAAIPSPSVSGFHLGPVLIHFYALMYIVGIALAVAIGRRRWKAAGGDPLLVDDMALWGVPFGILGGRLYFDATTPADMPHTWYGFIAVWDGGLGIWGGVLLATVVCVLVLRRKGVSVLAMMDTVAPCLLVAQAVGRIGNYFNQELFGKPSSLPWALRIDPAHRPPGFESHATFQPTFLYELVWDLALAALLIWLGRRGKIRPGGLFALYVSGYSAFRIIEESLRIDYSQHFLGLRLNFYIAAGCTLAGLLWFAVLQRRTPDPAAVVPAPAEASDQAADTTADPADEATPAAPDQDADAVDADGAGPGDEAAGTTAAAPDEAAAPRP
jgi:prolipoprotein diacylglyceryl transferase